MKTPDAKALQVTQLVQQRHWPELAILFGSRARGDHDETRSDVDIMLVQQATPDDDQKRSAKMEATQIATEAYQRVVPVDLVWRTLDEFRFNRRYENSVETNAVRDGVVMPRNPESYSASDYEDEYTGYAHDWTNYDERMQHSEIHLNEFIFMAEYNRSDLAIGQHAQKTLEHGMKALIDAAGGQYPNTHNIGELLGMVRHFDPEMSEFSFDIPPDVYTQYEGKDEYTPRVQPELTGYPAYVEKTADAASQIIERAKELRNARPE